MKSFRQPQHRTVSGAHILAIILLAGFLAVLIQEFAKSTRDGAGLKPERQQIWQSAIIGAK